MSKLSKEQIENWRNMYPHLQVATDKEIQAIRDGMQKAVNNHRFKSDSSKLEPVKKDWCKKCGKHIYSHHVCI